MKSATGKIITPQFYDYHSDNTAIAAALAAHMAMRREKEGGDGTLMAAQLNDEVYYPAALSGIEVEELPSFAASHGQINASGRAGAKINLQDTLARLRRKQKAKLLLRYQSSRSNTGAGDSSGKSQSTGDGGGGGIGEISSSSDHGNNNDSAQSHSHSHHHNLQWEEKLRYQDKDDFVTFSRKFRDFRYQQHVTYSKAVEEARSKLKYRLMKNREKGEKYMGTLTADSLDEDENNSVLSLSKTAEVDYYTGADETDPTLKLLRLNPYRWFTDKLESTYSLPHTEKEMAAINDFEEKRAAAKMAKKEKEKLLRDEQEAILNQKRDALKRRTAYLWSKLRNHALVIGHMVKSGKLDVQHSDSFAEEEAMRESERIRAALLSHSDSHSTLSTVPEETKIARDALMRDLELQRNLMQDITTFETDQNKIIVIQKKVPKRRGSVAEVGAGVGPDGQHLLEEGGEKEKEGDTAAALAMPQKAEASSSSSDSDSSSTAASSST